MSGSICLSPDVFDFNRTLVSAKCSTSSDTETEFGKDWKKNQVVFECTDKKHKEGIGEEIQKKFDQYSSCDEHKQILRVAKSLQIEFEIKVVAGLLKEVGVEYVKSVQATHVILHRKLKKEWNYFEKNQSCGLSRMKSDDTVEVIRQPQDNEASALPPGLMQELYSNPESRNLCLLCMNRNPLNGIKKPFTYAELQLAGNGFCPEICRMTLEGKST
ncbi:uncharacterized protein [Primulina huaijiensis]|uniref:uncharacterized protein n=1 Tax=Primulina huaijiensis TaxID=1492673 RepID=UPI003CC6E5A5